jgi:hypothetical protein
VLTQRLLRAASPLIHKQVPEDRKAHRDDDRWNDLQSSQGVNGRICGFNNESAKVLLMQMRLKF